MNEGQLSELREIARRYNQEEGGAHGPDHSDRVYRMALRLGREMDADLDILAPAALLHDIARGAERKSKGTICHAAHGAKMAAAILEEIGFSSSAIEKITHCIRAHRFRSEHPPASLEDKILYDADKLDSIGAIGIGRAFLFAGQIGACLHNPETDPATTQSYSQQDTAYREFQVKMSKVRDQLLTPAGRRIAQERHRFMELFFAQLNNEIYGAA